MLRENIYVGNIKKCVNYKRYKEDGEKTFLPSFEISSQTSSIVEGSVVPNSKILYEKELFVKIDDDKYIPLFELESLLRRIAFDFNLYQNYLTTYPTFDKLCYVDETSLEPLYTKEVGKQKVKLRKEIKSYYKRK